MNRRAHSTMTMTRISSAAQGIALSIVLLNKVALAQDSVAELDATAVELSVAQPESVGMSSEKLAFVTSALQKYVDEEKVPGAIVVVARQGKLVLFESVGWSDIEAGKPMHKDSILRFYSMTKPITSVATMMLVEDGTIALDDAASKYIPEFAGLKVFAGKDGDELNLEDSKRDMTIRDLLRHTSGLTYGFFGDTPIDRRYRARGVFAGTDTLHDMATKLSKIPLLYQPGARFNYSVSNDVLGHIVESVSGMRLGDFFQQRILEPLDMRDTGFHVPAEKAERFVNNYGPKVDGDGLRVIDDASDSDYLQPPIAQSGGGGLVSTARDYMRFCQMLLNKGELNGRRLLESSTIDQMTTNQLPAVAYPINLDGLRDGVGFGLGFSVVVEQTEWTKSSPIGEFGWGGAASTHFWISPKDELAIVVLTQHMPFSFLLENAVKPLVYDAIQK
jgi:CubicO group peptidase (beta-lactamase class C family)